MTDAAHSMHIVDVAMLLTLRHALEQQPEPARAVLEALLDAGEPVAMVIEDRDGLDYFVFSIAGHRFAAVDVRNIDAVIDPDSWRFDDPEGDDLDEL